MSVAEFASKNEQLIADAKNDLDKAYALARQTYRNENLHFVTRLQSFKIIMICEKWLKTDWEAAWNFEIAQFYKDSTVRRAMKKKSGSKYEMIVKCTDCIKAVLGMHFCPVGQTSIMDSFTIQDASDWKKLFARALLRCDSHLLLYTKKFVASKFFLRFPFYLLLVGHLGFSCTFKTVSKNLHNF